MQESELWAADADAEMQLAAAAATQCGNLTGMEGDMDGCNMQRGEVWATWRRIQSRWAPWRRKNWSLVESRERKWNGEFRWMDGWMDACDVMCVGVIYVMWEKRRRWRERDRLEVVVVRGTRAVGAFSRQQQLGRYGAQQLERENFELRSMGRRPKLTL